MPDHFALLEEPRRPWLDADQLKERFLKMSALAHPDRYHSAPPAEREACAHRYTELNSAFQTLRDPRARALHLLELESGARPRDIQRIPPGTMDLFTAIGQSCRDVDAYLAERQSIASPMLKVRLFQRGLEWVGTLQELQRQVQTRQRDLERQLQDLNAAWESAPPPGDAAREAVLPLAQLGDIYRGLSYGARWSEQLQERLVQLAAP